MTMTDETAPVRRPVVDGLDRADILRFASIMLGPPDRCHADRVTEMAAPLLEWAAQASDEDDLRLRMRAMRRQHANTQMAYSRARAVTVPRGRFSRFREAAGLSDAPEVWVAQSVITTPGRFLAEAAVLYGFMTAART